jgi:hypothetical protein
MNWIQLETNDDHFFHFLGYYAELGDLKPTFRDYLTVPPSIVKLSQTICRLTTHKTEELISTAAAAKDHANGD